MDQPVVSKFNKFPRTRWQQIPQMLQEQHLDVLVAVSPENVAYTSGHSEDTLHILRDRISATIIPADGDPIYLVASMLENQARLYSWIKDVRGYKHDESPIKVMADILEERGFTGGNVALEKEYFTAGYYEELCGYLPKARYADGSTILAKARAVKSEEEIAFIEAAENANETAHLKVYRTLRPGDSEIAIARRLLAQNLLEGADFTNHVTVNAGKNTTIGLRYIPDETPIRPGDVVTIDTGCKYAGYTTDMSRPVVVGKPNERQQSMWRRLWEANRKAVEATRAGVRASEMYAHLRRMKDYENVWFYAHGLGLFVHEPPLCTPYFEHGMRTTSNLSANWEIQPNMLLMVENSLRDPAGGQNYHFEDLVLVTENGARILSTVMDTREMFVVE